MSSNNDASEEFLNTINDDFFIDIVEKKLKLDRGLFKLRLVLLSPATGVNENYTSVLYRAKIKFELFKTKTVETVEVIIKVLLTTSPEVKQFSVFLRERFMYEDVIKSLEDIWLSRTNEKIQFGPASIKIESDPFEIIILEDLKLEGYALENRKIGLNIEYAQVVLSKLAKFHATSTIRFQNDGMIHTDLDRKASMGLPKGSEYQEMLQRCEVDFKCFTEAVRSYGDCDEYADKFATWGIPKICSSFVDVAEPMNNGFQVLNHGDMWTNNFMFKNNSEGRPIDVKLIDYQMSYWASPAGDLIKFQITSVQDDIKVDQFDNLIYLYHTNLVESLKELKYDKVIPTLEEIHADILENRHFAFTNLMFDLSICKNDSNEEITNDNMMENKDDREEAMNKIFQNENFKKALKFLNLKVDTMSSSNDETELFLNSETLDDAFFISIVENKLKINRDQFKVCLVLLSPATGANENFCSVLYRAKIKIQYVLSQKRDSVDVIIKALLSTLPEMKEFSVFSRERFMYENIIESFEAIWKDAGEEIRFGPRCIKIETDPYEILVFDDLNADGFAMANRKVGLTLEQAKIVLNKLAKFHASSAIRFIKDGMIHKDLDRKSSLAIMEGEKNPMMESIKLDYKCFTEAVRSYGDCDEYADKIAKWDVFKICSSFVDLAVPMDNGFQVLNHGDMWVNNFMIKSDSEGSPIDVKLIDYQMSYWASPVGDLIYFIISSIHDDIKVDHFDNLIEYYHTTLVESLKKLKYDRVIPTLEELHADILKKGHFACICLMFILFICKYDSGDEITMEIFMRNDEGKEELMNKIYRNENYKKAIIPWLRFLDQRNFLSTI
ncbi:unnamed protein product [Diamesa serratosioi]